MSVYIAIPPQLKITILKEGYIPKLRGNYIPAAKTPEAAQLAYNLYNSGVAAILQAVNEDGSDVTIKNGYGKIEGNDGIIEVQPRGTGLAISTTRLDPLFMRQVGAEKKAQDGIFCLPVRGLKTRTLEEFMQREGQKSMAAARREAQKDFTNINVFAIFRRGGEKLERRLGSKWEECTIDRSL